MVNEDEISRFMGRVETSLDNLKAEVKEGFSRVDGRFEKGELRFQKMEALQVGQSTKITKIFTGLWVGRAALTAMAAALGWLGFDHILPRK